MARSGRCWRSPRSAAPERPRRRRHGETAKLFMRTFASKDVIGVIVLLVLFLFAILVLAGSGHGGPREVGLDLVPDPSIYNDRASGTEGLYEWCGRMGYRTRPWRQDWASLPDDASVLICTAPRWSPSPGTVVEPGGEEPTY